MTMRQKKKKRIEMAAVILIILAAVLFSAWYALRHENEDLTEENLLTEAQLAGVRQQMAAERGRHYADELTDYL